MLRILVSVDFPTASEKDREYLEQRVDDLLCFGTVKDSFSDAGLDVTLIQVVSKEEV